MRRAAKRRMGRCAGGMAILLALAGQVAAGDDNPNPSLLGRLFGRGGGGASSGGSGSGSSPSSSRLPYGGASYNAAPTGGSSTDSAFGNSLSSGGGRGLGTYGNPAPPAGASMGAPATPSNFGGLPETPPVSTSGGPGERITPRSRVSNAVTTADPVLTRFALGRSNDGSSFGMFLQVFADGTVVDSEGVHHVRPADLKPILEAVQSGELYRMRGHCGAPSTDFIEYVHIVAYERRLGRLQAHSFSYSGNPQGCDHAIRHLHTALENLQARLSRPASATAIAPRSTAPAPAPMPATPAVPSTTPGAGPVIPLTNQ